MQSKTQGQPKAAGNLVKKKNEIPNVLSTLNWTASRALRGQDWRYGSQMLNTDWVQ